MQRMLALVKSLFELYQSRDGVALASGLTARDRVYIFAKNNYKQLRIMYIRFVVGGDDEHHRLLSGIITEARLLRDRGGLHPYAEEQLEDIFHWFNTHLPCPPFSSSDWPRDVVSWFKDSAESPIAKMHELAAMLEQHDLTVRILRSRNPGKLYYEDDYQIVVEEWKAL